MSDSAAAARSDDQPGPYPGDILAIPTESTETVGSDRHGTVRWGPGGSRSPIMSRRTQWHCGHPARPGW
eukprot:758303-Hanusia_phi.AAC.1